MFNTQNNTIMRNKFFFLIALTALLCSCENWEPNIPKGDQSLREQIDGMWEIQAYITSNGKQEAVGGKNTPTMVFSNINNNTYEIYLHYVNDLQTKCVLGENNQITILDQWGGTEMYDSSGNEGKFLDVLNNTDSGFIRNDSLFLITDSQKQQKYKAVCLTRVKVIFN